MPFNLKIDPSNLNLTFFLSLISRDISPFHLKESTLWLHFSISSSSNLALKGHYEVKLINCLFTIVSFGCLVVATSTTNPMHIIYVCLVVTTSLTNNFIVISSTTLMHIFTSGHLNFIHYFDAYISRCLVVATSFTTLMHIFTFV